MKMPRKDDEKVVFSRVMNETKQTHQTRVRLVTELEKLLGRPILSFFTSFTYPVMIQDGDADMIEGMLQKMDLSKGLALIISSPGGDGVEAERIINVCREYSSTGEYWAIVPSKAKSAATMICFGADKVYMGSTSELGPVDPQITFSEGGQPKRFSLYNIVTSYDGLFRKAVRDKKGNLEPYLQQLQHYDEREIAEFRSALELSEDIAVRTLKTGMMKNISDATIKKKIQVFLSPKRKKIHSRPIYRDEAGKCGMKIEEVDVQGKRWQLIYELYVRITIYMNQNVLSKCIESKADSFHTQFHFEQ